LIELKVLPAIQVLPGAPWQIAKNDADCATVVRAAQRLKRRECLPKPHDQRSAQHLPGLEDGHDAIIF
jgi:hypothetical protein